MTAVKLLMLVFISAAAATAQSRTVPIMPAAFTLDGVLASTVRHDNRDALRLIEADNRRAGGLALVNGLFLRNGTIEIEVAGRRGPYAVADDRGFIGVAFRVSSDRTKYEYIYLRPDNGRAEDQVRRNHSIQYSAHPDFPWPRMRKEFPEKYESYVDLQPGVWTAMRIEVSGTTARLFVDANTQPNLIVTDLKLGASEGGIGLWIGPGTEGFFSNLRMTPR
jgi:hypothetical protein